MLVYNSKERLHLGKIKLKRWGPCTIKDELDLGSFLLKNIDGTIQPHLRNGYKLKLYSGLEDPRQNKKEGASKHVCHQVHRQHTKTKN